MDPISVVFLVYPGLTQLDFTGPAQVLSRLGKATVVTAWKTRDPVATDSGFSILPSATLGEVDDADILCIPGGFGSVDMMEDAAVLDWVREMGGRARWVTSVCTGSLILAAAGLLDGYRATSHWAWREHLRLFGAEPVDERIVFDRNRVTGGGVTAGIDFALALTAAVRGEGHARIVQLALEYDPAPPFDAGSPAKAGEALVARLAAIDPAAQAERVRRIGAVAAARGSIDG